MPRDGYPSILGRGGGSGGGRYGGRDGGRDGSGGGRLGIQRRLLSKNHLYF